jgi:arsenate reductase (glutaredoxin)
MTSVVMYHNPRCSKSRQTLALLEEKDVIVQQRLYLEDAPTVEELEVLCAKLKLEPIHFTRVKESLFKELGLSKTDERSRREWCKILSANPKLIERPIVIVGNKARLGRPPESVLEIIA